MKRNEVLRVIFEGAYHTAIAQDAAQRALVGVKRYGGHEAVPMLENARDGAHDTLAEILVLLTPELRKRLKRELRRRRGIKIRLPRPKVPVSATKEVS